MLNLRDLRDIGLLEIKDPRMQELEIASGQDTRKIFEQIAN